MAGAITRHFATLGQRQVHYRRAGAGPPVVLLHPSPESSEVFVELIERLAPRYTVLAPDTPGNGFSDPLEEEWPEMTAFADNVVALLDILGVPTAAIYGYHTGALCALELARRHPDRLVLCVANGYLQMEETLQRDIAENYFVQLAPIDWSGSHLTWVWSRMREQWNFFPWYKKTLAYRGASDPPDAEGLHRAVMHMLRAGDGYRGAYRAAFTFDAPQAVQQARATTLVTCPRDDILFPCLAAMPKPADCVRVVPADDLRGCEDLLERMLEMHMGGVPAPGPSATTPIDSRIWSDTIQIEGLTLHLRRSTSGQGRPVLFIHDTAGSSRNWQNLMEALTCQRPLIGIDLPGRGGSDPWPEDRDITVGAQAEILAAALKTIGYDTIDLIADKGGASMAAELASKPLLVHRLFILEWPDRETADMDLLASSLAPDGHGGHLLKAWHRARDTQLFSPWHDRRQATAIGWREPDLDPVHIHQRTLDLLACAPRLAAFLAADRTYPLDEKVLALRLPVQIGCPQAPAAKRILAVNAPHISAGGPTPLDASVLAVQAMAFFDDDEKGKNLMERPLVTAMSCMTISAREPDRLIAFIKDGMGWEIRETGPITTAMEIAWGIEAGSAGGRFTLLASAGADRGMIRVVQGRDRYPSRQIGARWSGVEIVVMRDIDGLCQRLVADPSFKLTKPPENADFSDVGANIHRFFHGRPAGGTHFMFTMAITQPRDYAFPSSRADVGHIFSIPLVSDDYGTGFRFYRDTIGMIPMLEDHIEGGLWHSTWSLPEGLPVELSILKGDAPGLGFGGIELQGYDASVIDPVAPVANRFDGGTCMGSFTAADLDLAYGAIRDSKDARAVSAPAAIPDAPYNGARSFAFLGPGGERIEICEAFG